MNQELDKKTYFKYLNILGCFDIIIDNECTYSVMIRKSTLPQVFDWTRKSYALKIVPLLTQTHLSKNYPSPEDGPLHK